TVAISNQVLLVDDPAIGAVLLEESVLDRMAALLVEATALCSHPGRVFGMHAAPPERRIFEVLLRVVAEPVPDVLADERGREIPRCLVAVDHRGRAGQQVDETLLGRDAAGAGRLACVE